MPGDFQFDVFLSHVAKDKPVVRELAACLKRDSGRVRLDEEKILACDCVPARIEKGLESWRVPALLNAALAFGSDRCPVIFIDRILKQSNKT